MDWDIVRNNRAQQTGAPADNSRRSAAKIVEPVEDGFWDKIRKNRKRLKMPEAGENQVYGSFSETVDLSKKPMGVNITRDGRPFTFDTEADAESNAPTVGTLGGDTVNSDAAWAATGKRPGVKITYDEKFAQPIEYFEGRAEKQREAVRAAEEELDAIIKGMPPDTAPAKGIIDGLEAKIEYENQLLKEYEDDYTEKRHKVYGLNTKEYAAAAVEKEKLQQMNDYLWQDIDTQKKQHDKTKSELEEIDRQINELAEMQDSPNSKFTEEELYKERDRLWRYRDRAKKRYEEMHQQYLIAAAKYANENFENKSYTEIWQAIELEDDEYIKNALAKVAEQKATPEEVAVQIERTQGQIDELYSALEGGAEGYVDFKELMPLWVQLSKLKDTYTMLTNKEKYEKIRENPDYEDVLKKGVNGEKGDKTFSYITGDREVSEAAARMDLTRFDYMEQDEINDYLYIYASDGRKAADAYLKYLSYELNEKRMNKIIDEAERYARAHPGAASARSIYENLIGSGAPLDAIAQHIWKLFGDGNPVDYNSAAFAYSVKARTERGTVAEGIKSASGRALYNLGMSMVDSAVLIPVDLVTGGWGTVLLGGSAATQAILDAHERGATDFQAVIVGVMAGAAETFFEKYSIDNLFELGDVTSAKEFFQNILYQMLPEGYEEGMTTLVNTLVDAIFMGDKSEYETRVKELLDEGYVESDARNIAENEWVRGLLGDVVGGMISGGVFGAVKSTGSVLKRAAMQKISGSRIKNGTNSVLAVLTEHITGEKTELYSKETKELAGKVNEMLMSGKEVPVEMKNELAKSTLAENPNFNTRVWPQLAEEIYKREAEIKAKTELKTAKPENITADMESSTELTQPEAQTGDIASDGAAFNNDNDVIDTSGTIDQTEGDVINERNEIQYGEAGGRGGDAIADRGYNNESGIGEDNGARTEQNQQRDVYEPGRGERGFVGGRSNEKNGNSRADTRNTQAARAADRQVSVRTGDVEAVSPAMAGIRGGSESRTMYEIPRNAYDSELTNIENDAAKNGITVHFFTGSMGLNSGTSADGAQTGDVMWVKADGQARTATENYDHEKFHNTVTKNSRGFKAVALWLKTTFTSGQLAETFRKYFDKYENTYSLTEMSEDEVFCKIAEEIMADAYAGVDRFNSDASTLTEAARTFAEETGATSNREYNDNQGRAPPQGMSYDDVKNAVREVMAEVMGEKNTALKNGQEESQNFAIAYDENNTPFVIIEDDILSGVAKPQWVKTVKDNLRRKYPNGISISKENIRINTQTVGELTNSEYTQWIRDHSPQEYADKFRATNNIDEILLATQNWIGEGPKHTRKDNIREFGRGQVAFRIGSKDYSADVVVATTKNGNAVMYDLVNLSPISIKEKGHSQTASDSETGKKDRTLGNDPIHSIPISDEKSQEQNNSQFNSTEDNTGAFDRSDPDIRYAVSEDKNNVVSQTDIEAVQSIGRKSINEFTSQDIKATERYAKQYWNEMGEKSPFFRAWFGDWRAHDTTPVAIATEKGDARGRTQNDDTGWDINVSGKVFNETKAHTDFYNKAARAYLPYLNDIIKKAVLLDSYGVGKTKSPNSLLMHSLYAVADIGNGPEILKLYVEEMNDPNTAGTAKRAYQLQNIEKTLAANVRVQGKAPSSVKIAASAIENISDLHAAVKARDKSFNPKSVNPVLLNEDGKPMVLYHGTDSRFTVFKQSELRNREGSFFFAQNREDAEAYSGRGNVMEVYVSLENPVDYNDMPSEIYELRDKREQVEALKKLGYDGWYADMDTGWGEVSAFYPEQIKSATDNTGAFDRSNQDIRYAVSDEGELSEEESILPEQRTWEDASNRNMHTYGYTHPELRPYYVSAARQIYLEVLNSLRGGRFGTKDNDGYYAGSVGVKRNTTQSIASLLDDGKMTYERILTAAKVIADGEWIESQHRRADVKKVEMELDNMLQDGFTDTEGYDVPPDEGYSAQLEATKNGYAQLSDYTAHEEAAARFKEAEAKEQRAFEKRVKEEYDRISEETSPEISGYAEDHSERMNELGEIVADVEELHMKNMEDDAIAAAEELYETEEIAEENRRYEEDKEEFFDSYSLWEQDDDYRRISALDKEASAALDMDVDERIAAEGNAIRPASEHWESLKDQMLETKKRQERQNAINEATENGEELPQGISPEEVQEAHDKKLERKVISKKQYIELNNQFINSVFMGSDGIEARLNREEAILAQMYKASEAVADEEHSMPESEQKRIVSGAREILNGEEYDHEKYGSVYPAKYSTWLLVQDALDSGTYKGMNVDKGRILNAVQAMPEELSGKIPTGDYSPAELEAKLRADAAAEKEKRLEIAERKNFTGSEAMEKLGIKIEGSNADYKFAKSLLERGKANRELVKEMDRAIRRMHPTPDEKDYAKLVVDNRIPLDELSSKFDSERILELADYMGAKRAAQTDLFAAQKEHINMQNRELAEERFRGLEHSKKLKIQNMNYMTPRRIVTALLGETNGQKVYESFFAPVRANEAERIRFSQDLIKQAAEITGSDGKKGKLNRAERAITQMVIEGKAAAEAVAQMETNARERVIKAAKSIMSAEGNTGENIEFEAERNKNAEALARRYEAQDAIKAEKYKGVTVDSTKINNALRALKDTQLEKVLRRKHSGFGDRSSRLTPMEKELVKIMAETRSTEDALKNMSEKERQRTMNAAEDIRANGEDGRAEKRLALQYAVYLAAKKAIGEGSYNGKKIDNVRVDNAAKFFNEQYSNLYNAINEFLVAHGYEPIGFIKGYAPHMQPESALQPLERVLQWMGAPSDITDLRAAIAGETHNRKPNKKWVPYFQARSADSITEYDIYAGFDSYVDYISEVFYHTDDIMRLREASRYLRSGFVTDTDQELIGQIKDMRERGYYEKFRFLEANDQVRSGQIMIGSEIDEALDKYVDDILAKEENQKAVSSELVMWLDNYTNLLAGKQSALDRGLEQRIGRNGIRVANKVVNHLIAAQVVGNMSSSLNQFAQMPITIAELGPINTAMAIKDMVVAPGKMRQWALENDFLVPRKGTTALNFTPTGRITQAMATPLEITDYLMSQITARAAYRQGLSMGMSEDTAMKYSVQKSEDIMGSRAKGSKPVGFDTKNPLTRLVNAFQIEALNQWEHIGRDMPKHIKQIAKSRSVKAAVGEAAKELVTYLFMAFLINILGEKTYGGSPAPLDLIGIIGNFFAAGNGYTLNEGMIRLINGVVGRELLDEDHTFDAVRDKTAEDGFNLGAAWEDTVYTMSGEVPMLNNILAAVGLTDDKTVFGAGVNDTYKYVTNAIDSAKAGNASDSIYNFVMGLSEWVMGGRQIQKSVEGIRTYAGGGGRYTDGRLTYPVEKNAPNLIKGALFGRSAFETADAYYAAGGKVMSEGNTDLYKELTKAGMPVETAYDTVWRLNFIESDKDENGETINSSAAYKKLAYVEELDASDQVKEILVNNILTDACKEDYIEYELESAGLSLADWGDCYTKWNGISGEDKKGQFEDYLRSEGYSYRQIEAIFKACKQVLMIPLKK